MNVTWEMNCKKDIWQFLKYLACIFFWALPWIFLGKDICNKLFNQFDRMCKQIEQCLKLLEILESNRNIYFTLIYLYTFWTFLEFCIFNHHVFQATAMVLILWQAICFLYKTNCFIFKSSGKYKNHAFIVL